MHYRTLVKLGEGCMGEVYRATDTQLGRGFAIKIPHEAFAQDAVISYRSPALGNRNNVILRDEWILAIDTCGV